MMPISELPMGIFDQTTAYTERPPAPEAATHLSKLEQKRKSTQAAVAARKLSGIMMDKWSTVQGKIFFVDTDAKLPAILYCTINGNTKQHMLSMSDTEGFGLSSEFIQKPDMLETKTNKKQFPFTCERFLNMKCTYLFG